MAAPTYGTDLSDITTAETTTGWSALGGGASGLNDETDYYIQGNQCISKNGFTSDLKGHIFNAGATTITSGDAVFIWIKQNNRNLMNTIASGGTQVLIGSGTNAFDQFYVDGNNSSGSALAGWRTYAVDPNQTPSNTTGSPSGTSYFGAQWDILGSGSLKGAPNGIDVIRHGRELTVIDGDLGNGYGTFDGAASFDADTTRAWGILTPVAGGYQFHGAFVMGTTGTAVDFRDSNRNIVVLDDLFLPAGFNEFEIRNASSNVEWTNITIQHLNAVAPAVLTFNVGTFTGEGCRFDSCSTTIFNSSSTCNNTTWVNCDAVSGEGADLIGSSILRPNVAADEAGLIWNVATDPDGLLDNMEFTKTSGTAHHAIEFGTNVPTSMTLRNCLFGTDWNASNGNNDSTFNFLDTAGTSITLNLVGCTGTFSYKTAGATITLVEDPVTTTITVLDDGGSPEANVRVIAETANGTGPLPYQEAVTITQSGGTANVAHTAHGLDTNQYAVIRGATEQEYNKVAQVTVTTPNHYEYTVDSGASSPATGSPISSAVIVYGLTDGSGEISDTRTFGSNQPITGWARKSTSAPYFKPAPITGTISSTNGFNATLQLILDQ